MSTLFNVWHFSVLGIIFLFFIAGVFLSFKQKPKLILPMIFSVFLITVLIAGFSIVVVDKYTKIAKIYKLKNKRLLSLEKIIYSGVVKNEGKYTIGKVIFEIKLVNRGHATGNVKAGSFYKPSGFSDFFSSGSGRNNKPQQITKQFLVAKNLKPGNTKEFRVRFDYPPYFRSTAQFSKLIVH
ncbi:MAG: DUF2393 domain-containing protein [Sulfurimonas sp.]|nr:DUF2393 domain-containing protein [Sulfurimonas sp.]